MVRPMKADCSIGIREIEDILKSWEKEVEENQGLRVFNEFMGILEEVNIHEIFADL